MAFLVTGGTGFVGSYVVRDLLKKGETDIVCFQRSGVTSTFRDVVGEENVKRVKIAQGDVANTVQLFNVIKQNKVDVIVHLGYILTIPADLNPAYALQVNCVGMNNILEAARLFGLKKIVWSSSNREFGRIAELYKEPIGDDNAIYMPDSMYGATKVLNEFMTRLYFDKFKVDSVGIRLGRTFGGVGKWASIAAPFSEFLKNAALNIPVTLGKGDVDPERGSGYTYIDDMSELIVKACYAPTTKTRVFNAVEGIYTNKQLVDTVRKVNPQAKITVDEKSKAKVFVNNRAALLDTSGVKAELGWTPRHNLESGLREFFNQFRKEAGLPLLKA